MNDYLLALKAEMDRQEQVADTFPENAYHVGRYRGLAIAYELALAKGGVAQLEEAAG